MSSRSLVDSAPARCSGGQGLIPVRGSEFFFVPHLYHVDHFTFHILLRSLKFTIFIHLSFLFLLIKPFK